MRARLARMGVVTIGLLALVAGLTPPAHAVSYLSVEFVGTATLASGLGYPCIGPAPGPGGTTTVGNPDTGLCPTTKVDTPLTAPPLTLLTRVGTTHFTSTQIYPDFHHNKKSITGLSTTICVAEAVNVAKPPKATTQTDPGCSITLNTVTVKPGGNTVAGNCGLSSGQVQAIVSASGQTFDVDVHFVGVGGEIYFEGHIKKRGSTRQGLVAGLTLAVPPLPLTLPTSDGTSCANKTARTFTLAGAAGAVLLN